MFRTNNLLHSSSLSYATLIDDDHIFMLTNDVIFNNHYIKIKTDGTVIWAKMFIVKLSGFTVTAFSADANIQSKSIFVLWYVQMGNSIVNFLLAIDLDGNFKYQQAFVAKTSTADNPVFRNSFIFDIKMTSDEGLMLMGSSFYYPDELGVNPNAGVNSIVIRVDKNMSTKWISSLDFDSKSGLATGTLVSDGIVYGASNFDYDSLCFYTLSYDTGTFIRSNWMKKNLAAK